MTKEEMLETAEDGNISELNHLIAENILSAKQAYCGKVLTFRGNIYGKNRHTDKRQSKDREERLIEKQRDRG